MDTNFQTIDNSTFTDPILKEVESVLYFIVQNYKSFIQDSTNTHEKISEFDKELGDVLERYKQLYNITSNITEEELQKIASEFRTEIAKLKTSTELLNSDLTKKVTVDYKGLIDAQLQSVDNLIIDINNKVTVDYKGLIDSQLQLVDNLITDINNKVINDYFKGDKGEPFLYSDFTPEQLESLKVKGDKGDSFKYTDFTSSQLDSLMDIHSKTAKTTPVDADEIILADSTSSFSLKKITWATIKSLFANRLPTSTLNSLVKFGDTVGTLKNGVGAYLTDSGNMLIGTTVNNGVDKLQVNGTISALSNVLYSSPITGTFTAGLWYNTGITSDRVYDGSFDTLYGINFYENSYNTPQGNYNNVHTFITGPFTIGTNSNTAVPLTLLSRTGHSYNGGTVSLRWLLQPGWNNAILQFSLSAGGVFTNVAGNELQIKLKKIL